MAVPLYTGGWPAAAAQKGDRRGATGPGPCPGTDAGEAATWAYVRPGQKGLHTTLQSDPYSSNAMHCAEQLPAIALPIEVGLTNRKKYDLADTDYETLLVIIQ